MKLIRNYSILFLAIILYGFSIKGGHKKYPKSIERETTECNCIRDYAKGTKHINVKCEEILSHDGRELMTTDTTFIREFIELITDNRNFTYRKNVNISDFDACNSYKYEYNGQMNSVCFNFDSYMVRNDSIFEISNAVKDLFKSERGPNFIYITEKWMYTKNGKLITFSVNGTVIDKDSRKPIKGVYVHKIGSDGSNDSVITDNKGRYMFDYTKIKDEKAYIITCNVHNLKYVSPGEGHVNTVGASLPKVFTIDFELEKQK